MGKRYNEEMLKDIFLGDNSFSKNDHKMYDKLLYRVYKQKDKGLSSDTAVADDFATSSKMRLDLKSK